jgi:hypothetical protein
MFVAQAQLVAQALIVAQASVLAQAPLVAQAPNPNCYFPPSQRQCQAVKPEIVAAPPPPEAPPAAVAPAGSSLNRLGALAALPILGGILALIATSGGGGDDSNGVVPIPEPVVIPGLLLGAGALWAARRHRATLIAAPLLFMPLVTNASGQQPTMVAIGEGPEEQVFPLFQENNMTATYGGKPLSITAPFNIPRDTAKFRYFVTAADGGYQVCWEEIKPQICPPPQATPRRIMW